MKESAFDIKTVGETYMIQPTNEVAREFARENFRDPAIRLSTGYMVPRRQSGPILALLAEHAMPFDLDGARIHQF